MITLTQSQPFGCLSYTDAKMYVSTHPSYPELLAVQIVAPQVHYAYMGLDRKQVVKLHKEITKWLKDTK